MNEWSAQPMSEAEAIRVCLRNHLYVPYEQLRRTVYGNLEPQPDEEFVWASALDLGDRIRVDPVFRFLGVHLPTAPQYTVVQTVSLTETVRIADAQDSFEIAHNFPMIRVGAFAPTDEGPGEDSQLEHVPVAMADAASQWRHYTASEARRAARILLDHTSRLDGCEAAEVFADSGEIADRDVFVRALRRLCGLHPETVLASRLDEYLNYLD